MRKLLALLFIALAAPVVRVDAVLPDNALYEIRHDASGGNVNGGGFAPPLTTVDNLQANPGTGNTASPVVGSPNYSFVSTDVGAWVYISSGTDSHPGCMYQITAVANSSATLDATLGNGECIWNQEVYASTNTGISVGGSPTGINFIIDYSRSTGSITLATDLASSVGTSTPSVVSSVAAPFKPVMAGNYLRINSGTSWIQGAFWIQSVDASGNATVDRAVGGIASLTNGTGRVGGAYSMGNNTTVTADDAIFELAGSVPAGRPGARYFVRKTTFTITVNAVTIAAAGTLQQKNKIIGYQTRRTDRPTGSNRPELNLGANAFTLGTLWDADNLDIYGTAATMFTSGSQSVLSNVRIRQKSGTASQTALTMGASSWLIGSEVSCYRGTGINLPNGQAYLIGNYIHSSSTGAIQANAAAFVMANNIFSGNRMRAFQQNVVNSTPMMFYNNTFYGSPLRDRGGVFIATATTGAWFTNNIFVNLSSGVVNIKAGTLDVTQSTGVTHTVRYNNFFNNALNTSTNVFVGSDNYLLDPQFVNVRFSSGTTATTSGFVLTQSGADFSVVVDSNTWVYLVSGTGITPGFYGVVGHTSNTLTLDVAPGTNATADKRWEMITGNNYAIGTNLKAKGFPGVFSSTSTTSYTDIGGVQRQESGGTRGYPIFY